MPSGSNVPRKIGMWKRTCCMAFRVKREKGKVKKESWERDRGLFPFYLSTFNFDSGDRQVVEDLLHQGVRAQLLGLRLVGHDQPVAEDVRGHRLHVLRGDVPAAGEEGVPLRR